MPHPRTPLPAPLGDAFSRADALLLGVTERRLRGADLEPAFHGARLRRGSTITYPDDEPQVVDRRKRERLRRRAEACASVLAAHSLFTGMTALGLFGAPLPDDFDPDAELHIASLHPHRATRARGTRGVQVRPHLVSVILHDTLPLASPASAWAMLGDDLPERWLVILGDALVRIPRDGRGRPIPSGQLTTREALTAAALASGRRHRERLVRAIEDIRVGSASRLETEYRLDASRAGLPEMELDVEIRDERGALLGIADGVHRRFGVIVEVDGDQHRTSRRQWVRDVERTAALTEAGWDVARVVGSHVRDGTAAGRIARVLRRHGWNPS